MNLIALTPAEFFEAYTEHSNVFGSCNFVMLNRDKAERIVCLSMVNEKGKHLIGMVLGERHGEYFCPFSAPFGEVCCQETVGLDTLQTFFTLVKDWLDGANLHIVLPPAVYGHALCSKLTAVLAPMAKSSDFCLSYHYDLANFANFKAHLHRSARYNFNRAQTLPFTFEKTDDLHRAYAVIKQNREEHGYYLSMTEEQVRETTTQAVKADFFVVSLNSTDIAAAIVFHVTPNTVQVVYWGDTAASSNTHVMNWLPYKVFEYYHSLGSIKTVDIGTANLADGTPNIGLINFKESLGCTPTLKPALTL